MKSVGIAKIIGCLSLIAMLGLVGIISQSYLLEIAYAQSNDSLKNYNILSWVKTIAGWWADEKISDSEFVATIEYFVQKDIIVLDSSLDKKTTEDIPEWIKNNARWWSDGLISDSDFVPGIEYMAKNGMLGNIQHEPVLLSGFIETKTESEIKGLKVTWENTDSKSHTITAGNSLSGPNGRFDSSLMEPQQSYSIYLTKEGTFEYFCLIHPWEYDTITVTENDLAHYYEELEKQRLAKEKESLTKKKFQKIPSSRTVA